MGQGAHTAAAADAAAAGWKTIRDYHDAQGLLTHDALWSHYNGLVGIGLMPSRHLADMLTYAWENALAP